MQCRKPTHRDSPFRTGRFAILRVRLGSRQVVPISAWQRSSSGRNPKNRSFPSFPRKRESSAEGHSGCPWTPAFAGATMRAKDRLILGELLMDSEKLKRIEQRAYLFWQAEGQPHGRHEEHWHRAARQVEAE